MSEQQTSEQTAQPATSPELSQQDRDLLTALAAGRARHPADFDLLLPAMDALAVALYPRGQYPSDPKGISAEEFLEVLYVAAKYAYFAEDARRIAFAQQPKGIQ